MRLKKDLIMKKEHVKLTETDLKQLQEMLQKGSLKSRTFKRITALLELDKGHTLEQVKSTALLSTNTLGKLAKKYALVGLDCLYDLPRPGRPVSTSPELKDKITILSCETPPKGHSQWSIRLLADRVVQLEYCDKISHTQVHKILKKKG